LLYQVATGLVASGDIATPLRELVGKQPNVQILLGEVTELIPDEHQIVFNGKTFSYDHLVLATGSGSSFFGQEHWRTFAPPMKILEHAEEIRRRLLMAMEQAEQTPNPEARQFLQTVVVIRQWSERLRDGRRRLSNAALVPEGCLPAAGSNQNPNSPH
jgi:NADH dehydrogenase